MEWHHILVSKWIPIELGWMIGRDQSMDSILFPFNELTHSRWQKSTSRTASRFFIPNCFSWSVADRWAPNKSRTGTAPPQGNQWLCGPLVVGNQSLMASQTHAGSPLFTQQSFHIDLWRDFCPLNPNICTLQLIWLQLSIQLLVFASDLTIMMTLISTKINKAPFKQTPSFFTLWK